MIIRNISYDSYFAIIVGMRAAGDKDPDRFIQIRHISSAELEMIRDPGWWAQILGGIESLETINTSAQLEDGKMKVKATIKKVFVMGMPVLEVMVESSFFTNLKEKFLNVKFALVAMIGASILMGFIAFFFSVANA